jgi:UDP-glucose 4-epimerase
MKTIIITGGAGFVGSNLIKKLRNQYKIYSFDDYSTSKNHYSFNLLENGKYQEDENLIYVFGHTTEIFEKFNDINPSIIFHFGEFSRIDRSWYEISTLMNSLHGTTKVIEYCNKKNALLVYSASSAIFSATEDNFQTSPYTWTKNTCVNLIKHFHKWYNMPYIITYFYNVYGEGQISEGPYATVLGIFEKQYKTKEKLTVVKPGTQSRCFTHINDITEGIMMCINNLDNFINKDIPIGSEDNISIIDLAKKFVDEKEIKYLEERKGDRKESVKVLRDYLKENGWRCNIKLEEYIEKILKKK